MGIPYGLMMLWIHGYGTLNSIYGIKRLRELSVIAMMSEQSEKKRQKDKDSSINDYIAKPIRGAGLSRDHGGGTYC